MTLNTKNVPTKGGLHRLAARRGESYMMMIYDIFFTSWLVYGKKRTSSKVEKLKMGRLD